MPSPYTYPQMPAIDDYIFVSVTQIDSPSIVRSLQFFLSLWQTLLAIFAVDVVFLFVSWWHTNEKICWQRPIFFGRILSADKNRTISWRAQLIWLWCKHGRFRRGSSCRFCRTGCLNFKIISRHALRHVRPKRHFVCVFEWNRKTQTCRHSICKRNHIRFPSSAAIACSFCRFLILFITVIGRWNVTYLVRVTSTSAISRILQLQRFCASQTVIASVQPRTQSKLALTDFGLQPYGYM